ncbi:MAG: hypothetical protein ACOVKN_02400 [Arenimonas sp.]
MADDGLHIQLDEVQAVRDILLWARAGDVLALPVHGLVEREAVQGLLDAMQAGSWRAGRKLPEWRPASDISDGGV